MDLITTPQGPVSGSDVPNIVAQLVRQANAALADLQAQIDALNGVLKKLGSGTLDKQLTADEPEKKK